MESSSNKKTSQVTVVPGYTNNLGNAGQRVIFTVNNQQETDTLRFKYRSGNNPKSKHLCRWKVNSGK
ncbi:hypothetical protein GCM10020331_075380 [Ectobacillus funiculus]